MMPLHSLVEDLKGEIKKNILLEDEDKQYWLQVAETLPSPLLEYFYNFLKEKNVLLDSYIDKAIQADPDLLPTLKAQVKNLQKHFREFQEKDATNKENAETFLQEELKNI